MKKILSVIFSIVLPALLLAVFPGCQDESGAGKSVEEIQTDGKISSIIRSPISADGTLDTVNVAKIIFAETTFDFGEVVEGEVVTHVFKFKNTGKIPLVINNAHSTCGCTVPRWPKEPVPPGKEGEINVEFNSKARPGFQEKPVVISANTYPSNTTVYIKGYVNPGKAE